MSAFEMVEKNEYGLKNVRRGMYNGVEHLFTHRNPTNGKLYSDTVVLPESDSPGGWVPAESVELIYS